MSLILDALNRAERERNKTHATPNLQTVHDPVPLAAAPSRNNYYWLIVVALILVALLVTGYLVVTARDNASVGRDLSPMVAVPATSPARAYAENSQPDISSASPMSAVETSQPLNSTNASIRNAQVTSSAPSADLAALYASAHENEVTTPETPRVVEELYVVPPPKNETLESEIVVMPASQEAPVAKPKNAIEAGLSASLRNYDSLVDLPDIGDLPSGFRTQIATINYLRHNFDAEGGSTVVINGKAHRAGATVAENLMVEEIFMDGLILRYKQTRFKLRALNSWINM